MKGRLKKRIGYGLVFSGLFLLPLIPFFALVSIPLIAIACGAPIAALLFALLVDTVLLPTGAPITASLMVYTLAAVPLQAILVRYI